MKHRSFKKARTFVVRPSYQPTTNSILGRIFGKTAKVATAGLAGAGPNCGIGPGGFQPGNTCAKGGNPQGGSGQHAAESRTERIARLTSTTEFKTWFGDSKVKDEHGNPKETANIEGISAPVGPHSQPRIVYHGTPRGPFHEFKKELIANPDQQHYGPGFYFTEDVTAAEHFAQGGHSSTAQGTSPTVMSYFLKAEKPFDVDNHKVSTHDLPEPHRGTVRAAVVQRVLSEEGRNEALAAGRAFDEGAHAMPYRQLCDAAGLGGLGVSKAVVQQHLQTQGYDSLTTQAADPTGHGSTKNRYWIIFEPTQVKSTDNRGGFNAKDPNVLNAQLAATINVFCATGKGGGVDPTCKIGSGLGTKESPIQCGSDIKLALTHLAQGKHVRLSQPHQISTLIDRLHEEVQHAVKSGKVPPHFDLCKVTVPHTNLFCEDSYDIPRAQMPQMRGLPVPGSYADTKKRNKAGKVDVSEEFIRHLQDDHDIKVTEEKLPTSFLRASQSEIVGSRVAELVKAAEAGKDLRERPIFVTKDHYVLDGHHHWAAIVAQSAAKGKDLKIPVHVVNVDIGTAITLANDFAKAAGIAPKSGSVTTNRFCPTGPGGGVDPTCTGRHPGGWSGRKTQLEGFDKRRLARIVAGYSGHDRHSGYMMFPKPKLISLIELRERHRYAPETVTSDEWRKTYHEMRPTRNANPKGCNQYTGPGCSTGASQEFDKYKGHLSLDTRRLAELLEDGTSVEDVWNDLAHRRNDSGLTFEDVFAKFDKIHTKVQTWAERRAKSDTWEDEVNDFLEARFQYELLSREGEVKSVLHRLKQRIDRTHNVVRPKRLTVNARKPNPLKMDPTRTITIRRNMVMELRRRFKRLAGEIVKLVEVEDVFGLWPREPMTFNTRWQFQPDPEKVRAFQQWIKQQLANYVRGMTEQQLWEEFIKQGMRKGATRSFDDVRRGEPLPSELGPDSVRDFYDGTREEFLRDSFNQPVSMDKVRLLAGRAFEEMDNVTTDMSNRMSRVLVDGLIKGENPRVLAKRLNAEVGLGLQRAEVVAQTEIIRAHAEGQLDAFEKLGVEELGVAVEWSTAGDLRVCPKCASLKGIVVKTNEARGMIPRHPRCRCAWIPAGVGESKRGQKRTVKKIKKAVHESRDKGEDWRPGARLSEKRPNPLINALERFEQVTSPSTFAQRR